MIRSKRIAIENLAKWMIEQKVQSGSQTYRLRLWHANKDALIEHRAEIVEYFDEAHDDARKKLRKGFVDDLSPFDDPELDPAANYPGGLNSVTLQGYLGETLAVIAVEHLGAHGFNDWNIPAFLFRFHDVEFQHLDVVNERVADGEEVAADAVKERRPGRTGDDGIAFRLGADGEISHILTMEAKCLSEHKEDKIRDAHAKLAAGPKRPSGIRELISLLDEYETEDASFWQRALLQLWRGGVGAANRSDYVLYASGNSPVRGSRVSWLPADLPHVSYALDRNLEALEIHIEDLSDAIEIIYRGRHA